ncbi:hypothetical protein ACEQ8H_005315 [Pleosporales sp. CAS-2024a]
MPVKLEDEADVSNCVANLIHAFSNGLNIFKKLREPRRKRKGRKEDQIANTAASEESQLSKSLKRGPLELAQTYDACYQQTGQKYAKGDAIAHASLAETLVKLNTGLVAIIASFLNHDQKGGKGQLCIDYKSLTNLSDASRKEALQSMTQLHQRLSQSQPQLQHPGILSCAQCGTMKHNECSARSSTWSPSKDKRKQTSSRQRVIGPTITRMPIRSSSSGQPQLVVVRPRPWSKPSRKGSSSHNCPSAKTPSPPSSSTYTSALASPLPLYMAEEAFEIESNGIIKGILGGPMPPLAGGGRRRKDSFSVHDARARTGPGDVHPSWCKYPYIAQEPLHPGSSERSESTASPRRPWTAQQKTRSPSPGSEKAVGRAPVSLAVRRRLDKVTPSWYTFASDSTKMGEIPQRNWTMPWDYEEAERLNNEAAATAMPLVVVDGKVGRKKGMFKWTRKS